MQREILGTILKSLSGSKDGESLRCRDGHELTVYLGDLGRAMVVSHVQSITLLAAHAEIEARDRGKLLVPIESVCAVQDVQEEQKSGKRGGVGFSG